ncbi:MAG: cysteine desulfurase NifS [Clostridia bacterium]|nr:cysteine desulfurase NifS [Clostridia bacterium]
MKIRYFDHAATTKVNEEVIKEMIPYFGIEYGNASSLYSIGRKSKRAIDEARNKVAKAINANSKDIYFTACGSESDNLAIKGIAYANKEKGNHIITSKIEHHAVLNSCKTLEKQGFRVTYLNVDENGIINLEELKNSITDETILITIMYANNEIGTIEPIEEIGKIAKENNIIFHTDSVQAIGNVRIDVQKLNIDALSMSAHKFYGPKGVGALFIKEGIKFDKLQDGGHQERNKRAGTENVAGIIGLGKAIERIYENFDEYNEKLTNLRDYYIKNIEEKIPYIKLNGHRSNRLPGNANISFKFIEGEALLLNLDSKGICASTGSACASGSLDPSHVLLAIGLPHEIAHGSLRITIGEENTKDDIDYLVDCLVEIVKKLRNMSPLYEKFVNSINTGKEE